MTQAQSTAVAELDPAVAMRNRLARMEPEFRAALPAHIPSAKFVRTAQTAIQMNPDILQCDKRSVFGAIMKAAQDGLVLDGREAALVKFANQCQYMPMIAGVLKKARNSGEIAMIDAQMVHKNDKFTYRIGTDALPLHEPDWFGERGEYIGAYAIAKTKDGACYVEILSKSQIERIRAVSKSKTGPAWSQWWDEMARKSALRRLAKRLPSSSDREYEELQQALQRDEEMIDVTPPPPPTREQFADPVTEATPAAPSEADERAADRMAEHYAQTGERPIEEISESVTMADGLRLSARPWFAKFRDAKTQDEVNLLLADPEWQALDAKLAEHDTDTRGKIAAHFTKEI